MKQDQLLQSIFMLLGCMSLVSFLFFGLAIESYPGGNILNTTEEGFSFLFSAMSDLGRITAYNGEPNDVARIFYTVALDMLGIFVLVFYSIIWRFFQKRRVTKWLSLGGTIMGIAQACIYFVLTNKPPDTHFSAHKNLIYTAPAFLFAAILLYTIVFFIEKEFPRLNAYSYLVVIVIAILFTIAVAIGSVRQDAVFEASRRAGHTLFNFIITEIYISFYNPEYIQDSQKRLRRGSGWQRAKPARQG